MLLDNLLASMQFCLRLILVSLMLAYNFSFSVIIFLDSEGEPTQEFSAIAMDNETYKIVSVYHKHIDCKARDDVWSRQNYHGLNLDYLHKYGHCCLCHFIVDFQRWLNKFHILQLYANNPHKERVLLCTYQFD